MCRLFALHAGPAIVTAEFWLVDAPDSLLDQSYRNADGFGIGTFDVDRHAVVEKEPTSAWSDRAFATAAHRMRGSTFVAHVRHATTGALTVENTHPFVQNGREFAHNGVLLGDLAGLDERIRQLGASQLVLGQTDSERFFALITAETQLLGGDVAAGITAAVHWIVDHVEVLSLNFVLTTPTDLWAFRYPETDTLFLLQRPAGGTSGSDRPFAASGSHLQARSGDLSRNDGVVVASEELGEDPGWRLLASGELVHVDRFLAVSTFSPLSPPPG
jgi:glutamine amidotransferase